MLDHQMSLVGKILVAYWRCAVGGWRIDDTNCIFAVFLIGHLDGPLSQHLAVCGIFVCPRDEILSLPGELPNIPFNLSGFLA